MAPVLLQRAEQVMELLQDFRTNTRSDWSARLEEDCGSVLNQKLVQIDPPTHLEVAGRKQVGQNQNWSGGWSRVPTSPVSAEVKGLGRTSETRPWNKNAQSTRMCRRSAHFSGDTSFCGFNPQCNAAPAAVNGGEDRNVSFIVCHNKLF